MDKMFQKSDAAPESDYVLRELIGIAEKSEVRISLCVNTTDARVTGELMSSQAWLAELKKALVEPGHVAADQWAVPRFKPGGTLNGDNYFLHLRNAQIIDEFGARGEREAPFWRGRVSEIWGWQLVTL
ncbi:hypothetical protein [Glycomyces niveus]|uniref:Uncharacterized protein n=1 Tax=Glycomyces niveus TaxID=2820287 RepID=A0ABS3UCT6_9ACTN|nr:hypothetical protein [Glycomyces sp. NEAU-S30]MBO3735512.1 hypothetical protein [Glycomyces sp. NEAU-S30]